MSNATNLTITKDTNTSIEAAAEALLSLIETLPAEQATKVKELAKLTTPTVKGLEGGGQVTVPQIFIKQPSSNSEIIPTSAKPGDLYSSQGAHIGTSIDVIPILTHTLRKKWGEERIECMSLDGVTGSKYGDCATCPHGRFDKSVAPSCSLGSCFYVVTEDLTQLYRIDFLKSSAKAGKSIKRLIMPPALWSRSFTISTDKITGNNRNYHVFHASPTGRRTSDETAVICDTVHMFFKALHERAKQVQRAYSKNMANTSLESGNVTVTDDDSDVLDFSESM